MKDKKHLSDFLKQKRIDCGLSQMDVAKKLGYTSAQFVSNWERGLSSPPISTLRRLSDLYSIPSDELFEITLDSMIKQVTKDLKRKFYGRKGR